MTGCGTWPFGSQIGSILVDSLANVVWLSDSLRFKRRGMDFFGWHRALIVLGAIGSTRNLMFRFSKETNDFDVVVWCWWNNLIWNLAFWMANTGKMGDDVVAGADVVVLRWWRQLLFTRVVEKLKWLSQVVDFRWLRLRHNHTHALSPLSHLLSLSLLMLALSQCCVRLSQIKNTLTSPHLFATSSSFLPTVLLLLHTIYLLFESCLTSADRCILIEDLLSSFSYGNLLALSLVRNDDTFQILHVW